MADTCCRRVGWFLNTQCHCLPDFAQADRDRHHLAGLVEECGEREQSVRSSSREKGIRLFAGVLTAAKNHRARQAIRESWGSHPGLHRLLFFSAKPSDELMFDSLRREAAAEGDVVVLPSIWESYHNITYQTLEVLRFAAADRDTTHVLKADDDSYVRLDRLLARIEAAPNSRMFMGAIEDPGGGPHRDPTSQWYITTQEWPSERYPPWAHGAGYVLSQDLVREIAAGAALQSSNHSLFKLEDISAGAWVEYVGKALKWNINYVRDPSFNYNGCDQYDTVSHYIKPRAMLCMFKNGGSCCTSRTHSKPHFRGQVGS